MAVFWRKLSVEVRGVEVAGPVIDDVSEADVKFSDNELEGAVRLLKESKRASLRAFSKSSPTLSMQRESSSSSPASIFCSKLALNRAENLSTATSEMVKGGSHPAPISDTYVHMGGLAYKDAQAQALLEKEYAIFQTTC
jgi:hypothetical protein